MTVNAAELAKLYPLDSLRPENLEQLAKEATGAYQSEDYFSKD